MATVRRTLVVGLGKSGRLVARQLKETLQNRHNCLPYVSFFVVDLAEKDAGISPFTHSEEIALTTPGVREFVQQNPTIQARVPAGLSIDYGSGSVDDLTFTRLGANLLLMREVPRFQKTLEGTIRRLFDPKDWSEARQLGFEPEQGKDITVYVVASLAEPYGGGILLDSSYLIQSLSPFVADYTYSTTGLLMLFGDGLGANTANTYASLKELDYAMQNRNYENRHLKFASDKRPLTRSCHIIELRNEAHFDLATNADGRGMICEWLHEMMFNPLEAETIDVRLDRLATEPESPLADPAHHVPAYSSFGYAAYAVPFAEITDYFNYRFAEELIDQCLLSEAVTHKEVNSAVEEYSREEQKLDRESVVGLSSDRTSETRVSLSTLEQNEAALLFANSPHSPDEPTSPEDIPLEDLLERMKDEIRLQENTYFPTYSKKIQENVDRRLIPNIRITLQNKAWSFVEARPVGGIVLASQFLRGLAAYFHEASISLTEDQRQVRSAEENRVLAQYRKTSARGNDALINRPSILVTLGRTLLVFGLALFVMLGLGVQIAWESSNDLPFLLRNVLAILFVPQGFISLALMASICSVKYLIDWIIGWLNIQRRGDNLPSFISVAVSVLLVPAAGALVTWLFFRSSESLQLPALFRSILLSDYESRIVNAIILIGILATLNYVYWHWFDVHEMRRLANEWRIWHDKLALYRMFLRRTEVGTAFYEAAETAAKENFQRIDAFGQKLRAIRQECAAQSHNASITYGLIPGYMKYAMDFAQVKRIYEENIVNLPLECTQLFRPPRPSLLGWNDFDSNAIREVTSTFIEERFRDYWLHHGVTQLLSHTGQPSRPELERKLGWIAEENAKPYWTYYGVTQGTLRAFIGVGYREEEGVLLSTFEGLGGTIGAIPSFFDTGNRHTITCVIFRYDIPLCRLKTIEEIRSEYASAHQSPTLHVQTDPKTDWPDLLP